MVPKTWDDELLNPHFHHLQSEAPYKSRGPCGGLLLTFSKRSADVIHLSSSEDDSVSSKLAKAEESEPRGAHTDDAFNHPDAQGRVLVNLNHPSEEEDIFLSPQLARAVKPHQVLTPIFPSPPPSTLGRKADVFIAICASRLVESVSCTTT